MRHVASGTEGPGFTQDLSSRGVFFFTDTAVPEGAEIELTLNMPSEITLGESMRVRCRGRVLRVVKRPDLSSEHPSEFPAPSETKIGVAVRFAGYEYLPEPAESSAAFHRISSLHAPDEKERPEHSLLPTVPG